MLSFKQKEFEDNAQIAQDPFYQVLVGGWRDLLYS